MRREAREDRFVSDLVRRFPRTSLQLNRPHESDAELVRIPGYPGVLAITVDQIVEEVRTGLYEDPYLLGWMTVMASASDLAAVGADPVGVVVGLSLPSTPEPHFLETIGKGIADASAAAGLPVLGGDTAHDRAIATSGTALGWIHDGSPLTRLGTEPGHRLFSTGLFGLGSVFAWTKHRGEPAPAFLPRARLEAGRLARRFAAAAVDTSDGFLAACDLLLPRGGVDLVLPETCFSFLHPSARRLAEELAIPDWFLLAGPHGEFELLLSVPDSQAALLHEEARVRGIPLLELGEFREGSGEVLFPPTGVAVNPAHVRDRHPRAASDPRGFLASLPECSRSLRAVEGREHHARG